MIAVAVKTLDVEARAYMVSGVAATRFSTSAQPKDSSQTIRPPFAAATVMEGSRASDR